jgi:PDZ domain-containing secreted protein
MEVNIMAKKKAAPKAAAKAAPKAAVKEPLVVASKIKNYVRSKDMMTSSDAVAAVSDKIYAMLDAAIERCQANKRSTLKPHDL